MIKDIEDKYKLVSKCYVAIVNNDLSPSDYQIRNVSLREKNVVYAEIIRDWFWKNIFIEEDKNSALLELNYNPKVKQIVSQLYEKEIDLNTAKNKLAEFNYEPEHLAYMYGTLEDNFNVTTV